MALQPNFDMITNSVCGQFSTEIAKLQNLPQVANPEAILNAVQQLQNTMNNRFQGIENRLQGHDDRLQVIEDRLQLIDDRIASLELRMRARLC